MAERDAAVASMGSEAQQAKSQAAKAQEEVMRMEGVVRSTGERAAVGLPSPPPSPLPSPA